MNLARAITLALLGIASMAAVAASARDALGSYGQWAAFHDPMSGNFPRRCFAIAEPETGGVAQYATISFWPVARVRGQLYFRLTRNVAAGEIVALNLGGRRFELAARGNGAWARDARMDAAIVAALRSSETMRLAVGRGSSTWPLSGAASAIDAAALGCAR